MESNASNPVTLPSKSNKIHNFRKRRKNENKTFSACQKILPKTNIFYSYDPNICAKISKCKKVDIVPL